jgi:hypothetical protein
MTFDSNTGVYHKSLIDLSGEFKIVVESNGNLHFDDYTGRKINIDKTQSILHQISNFLRVSSNVKENLTYHGGYREHKTLKWHFPLYLSSYQNELPKYFVLHNKSDELSPVLHSIIDLEKIGLHSIFNEILGLTFKNRKIQHPAFFNWDSDSGERSVTIIGYDINQQNITQRSYILDDYVFNRLTLEPDLDFLNDYVLSKFRELTNSRIIFPKYINIEFEFESTASSFAEPLDDYHAYLSYDNYTPLSEFTRTNIKFHKDIKVRELSSSEFSFDVIDTAFPNLDNYTVIDRTITLKDVNEQDFLYRFIINSYQQGDIFRFYIINERDNSENLTFTYTVQDLDIKSTQIQTIQSICRNITINSEYVINATLTNSNLKIVEFVSFMKMRIELPNYVRYTVLDRSKHLQGMSNSLFFHNNNIIKRDVLVVGANDYLDIINYSQLVINDISYNIVLSFKFRDAYLLRLDSNPRLKSNSQAFLIQRRIEKIKKLSPINYILTESNIKIHPLYNIDDYRTDLNSIAIAENITFIVDGTTKTYQDFVLSQFNETFALENQDIVNINVNSKALSVSGHTAFLSPNIMNYDLQFGRQNGLYDANSYVDVNIEQFPFAWFLIKGECPQYLQRDVRKLRYFPDVNPSKPQLYSHMIEVTDFHCETVFLGIRYRLPITYRDYKFAAYLNPNNSNDTNTSYNFEIDILNKTIHLIINRYVDFSDLIRFGNVDRKPLLDLSLFYNIKTTVNTSQKLQTLFTDIGYKIGNANLLSDMNNVRFDNGSLVNHWIFNNQSQSSNDTDFYFLVNRSKTDYNFKQIYVDGSSPEAHYYVYINVFNELGEIEKKSVKLFTVVFENITSINDQYFWCKDIVYELYPENMYLWIDPLTDLDDDGKAVFTKIENYTYDPTFNIPQNFQNKYKQYFTSVNDDGSLRMQVMKFLLEVTDENSVFISLRNQYFRLIYYPEIVNDFTEDTTPIKKLFFFKNDDINPYYNTSEKIFYNQTATPLDVETLVRSYGLDTTSLNELDLFSTNAVWSMLRNMTKELSTNILSTIQVENILREFSIGNFLNFAKNQSIPLHDMDGNYLGYGVDLEIMNPAGNSQKDVNIIRHPIYYNPYMIDITSTDFQIKNQRQGTEDWRENLGVFSSRIFSFIEDVSIVFTQNFDISNQISMYDLISGSEEYIRYIFNEIYTVNSIAFLTNLRTIEFSIDLNNYVIRIDTELTGIHNLQIVLTRK